MYHFAICDDDPVFLDNLTALLEETLREDSVPFSLDTYTDTAPLFQAVEQEGKQYHVLLLDILMEKETGIALARRLRDAGTRSSIIFITSTPEFALESFDVNPIHYLLKPVSRGALRGALKRCLEVQKRDAVFTLACSGKSSRLIRLNEILYAEIFLSELKIHLKEGGSVTGVGKLSEMLAQLPESWFYRCHRSFVVNLEEVVGIRRFDFILENGRHVPIAQRKYNEAMRALSLYKG